MLHVRESDRLLVPDLRQAGADGRGSPAGAGRSRADEVLLPAHDRLALRPGGRDHPPGLKPLTTPIFYNGSVG
jgi:hypothetical protein